MKKTTHRNTVSRPGRSSSRLNARRTAAPAQRPIVPMVSNLDPDIHLIRLQLAKPPCERTHFLRVSLPNGGSCL